MNSSRSPACPLVDHKLPLGSNATASAWLPVDRSSLGAGEPDLVSSLVGVSETLSHASYGRWAPPIDQVRYLHQVTLHIGRRAHASITWRARLLECLSPRAAWGRRQST